MFLRMEKNFVGFNDLDKTGSFSSPETCCEKEMYLALGIRTCTNLKPHFVHADVESKQLKEKI